MKLHLLVMFFLFRCTQKPVSENIETASVRSHYINLPTYLDSLQHLAFSPAASLHALEIFRDHFDKHDTDQNDKAFKAFLEYQVILMDTLNNQLVNRPDYEKISSLIWADASHHEPEGFHYERQLNQYGLVLKSSEGFIYVSRNTNPIRTFFFDHLSPATKEFYHQFELETNQTLAEDGGLLITPLELAQWLAFWDTFLTKYPDHLFAEFAKNNKKDYLYYLLEGMDNTPAFDSETKKLYPEFLDAYQYLIQHASLACSAEIDEYVQLLKTQDFQRTDAVAQFIQQHVALASE